MKRPRWVTPKSRPSLPILLPLNSSFSRSLLVREGTSYLSGCLRLFAAMENHGSVAHLPASSSSSIVPQSGPSVWAFYVYCSCCGQICPYLTRPYPIRFRLWNTTSLARPSPSPSPHRLPHCYSLCTRISGRPFYISSSCCGQIYPYLTRRYPIRRRLWNTTSVRPSPFASPSPLFLHRSLSKATCLVGPLPSRRRLRHRYSYAPEYRSGPFSLPAPGVAKSTPTSRGATQLGAGFGIPPLSSVHRPRPPPVSSSIFPYQKPPVSSVHRPAAASSSSVVLDPPAYRAGPSTSSAPAVAKSAPTSRGPTQLGPQAGKDDSQYKIQYDLESM